MSSNRIPHQQLFQLAADILQAAGTAAKEATVVAEILTWCNAVDLPNQGVWRLPIFIQNLEHGGIKSPANISIEEKTNQCFSINGDGGFGHFICDKAANIAIDAALKQGLAAVAINQSNYCGALSYYAWKIAENGLISFIFSNSFPKVAAYQGIAPVLGTNPFAVGAPGTNGLHFLLDMSTSASAGSTITKAAENNEDLPVGIAIDKHGNALTNPNEISSGALLPFGGAKGFGLSLVVELMAGVIASAAISKEIKSFYSDSNTPGNSGQFILAISIETFLEKGLYLEKFEHLKEIIKSSGEKVRFPGEKKLKSLKNNKNHGIQLDRKTIDMLGSLSEKYKVHNTIS